MILTLCVALFTIATSFASEGPTLVTAFAGSLMKLDLSAWGQGSVVVSIESNDGNLLLNESLVGKSSKVYDLKQVPNGAYTLTIENEFKKATQKLSKNNDEIAEFGDAEVTFKPIVSVSKDLLKLNYLAQGKEVKVSIESTNDTDVFYTNTYAKTGSLNKAFDISNLPTGSYKIVISAGNETFTTPITK